MDDSDQYNIYSSDSEDEEERERIKLQNLTAIPTIPIASSVASAKAISIQNNSENMKNNDTDSDCEKEEDIQKSRKPKAKKLKPNNNTDKDKEKILTNSFKIMKSKVSTTTAAQVPIKKIKIPKITKKTNKSSWPNIFAQSKAVITIPINPTLDNSTHNNDNKNSNKNKNNSDSNNNNNNNNENNDKKSTMVIRYCDGDFLETFGYTSCGNGDGIFFDNFIGKATSLNTVRKIENNLRDGKTLTEYMNVYRSDKLTPLSCHISLIPLKNDGENSYITSNNSNKNNESKDIFGVITIRSASVVGNARLSALSFLGLEKVNPGTLENYYNKNITVQ